MSGSMCEDGDNMKVLGTYRSNASILSKHERSRSHVPSSMQISRQAVPCGGPSEFCKKVKEFSLRNYCA
jgi:hypothetical protein